jgi:predicted RNase H-like nuclease (RuvC/YqgF family)
MGDVIKTFTGSGSIKFDDRGDLDLTKQIEMLKQEIADLKSTIALDQNVIEELRQDSFNWQQKAGQVSALESRVEQQQTLIRELTQQNAKLRK